MISPFERKDFAMNHLMHSLIAVMSLSGFAGLRAAPPESDGDVPKKLQVKPPFPDSDLDELPVLPTTKTVAPERAPMPRTGDSNDPFDVVLVAAAEGSQPTGGKIGVGFFNHSERDIVLEIDGRTLKLGSRYYVQIKMPREFSWREKGGPARKAKVPAEADGVEIVFRK
jgi:hypothetical protein